MSQPNNGPQSGPYKILRHAALLSVAVFATAFAFPPASAASATATQPVAQLSGKLVIIGGGIREHSAAIHHAITDNIPDDATIGIVPTATEEPEASIEATRNRLLPTTRGSQTIVVIPLLSTDAAKCDDEAVAAQIRGCKALFFLGGDQNRILAVFHPEGHAGGRDTAISRAVDDVLAHNGIVAGTSAGAAMMSEHMLLGGTSAEALGPTTRKTREPLLGPGMGLFGFGIVDQHFLERGRLGRLIVALEQSNTTLGFGIPEDRALLVDRATAICTVIGDSGLLVVDRTHARTSKEARLATRTNLRLSLLNTGDTVNARTGIVTPAPGSRPYPRPENKAFDSSGPPMPRGDPWEKGRIVDMLNAISETPSRQFARNEFWELNFIADEKTIFSHHPSSFSTRINVRADLQPR